jgi:hypothetical protein
VPEILCLLVEHQGVQQSLAVTVAGPGLYRLEESIFLSEDELTCGDVVEGHIVDGTLIIQQRVARSPFVRREYVLSAAVIHHPEFEELKQGIVQVGGMWEILFGGLFFVHLPPDAALDVEAMLWRMGKISHD